MAQPASVVTWFSWKPSQQRCHMTSAGRLQWVRRAPDSASDSEEVAVDTPPRYQEMPGERGLLGERQAGLCTTRSAVMLGSKRHAARPAAGNPCYPLPRGWGGPGAPWSPGNTTCCSGEGLVLLDRPSLLFASSFSSAKHFLLLGTAGHRQ